MKKWFPMLLIVAGCSVAATAQSKADWKIFHHKNGFTIQLPASFSLGVLVASGTLQWFQNSLSDEIELTVETAGTGEKGKLKKEFEAEQSAFTTISYKVLKPSWYVISGIDEQGISYLKTILKNHTLHTLRISYPAAKKAMVDAWIPRIAASFL